MNSSECYHHFHLNVHKETLFSYVSEDFSAHKRHKAFVSPVTMVLSLISSPLGIIIGAAAGGGLLILILVIVAAVMCSRYRFCMLTYKGVLQSNEF